MVWGIYQGNFKRRWANRSKALTEDHGYSASIFLARECKEKEFNSTLDEVERKQIISVLESTRWRIGGANGAAHILGLNRQTLYRKMKELDISRPGS